MLLILVICNCVVAWFIGYGMGYRARKREELKWEDVEKKLEEIWDSASISQNK